MNGIINQFKARALIIRATEKIVVMMTEGGSPFNFKYHAHCRPKDKYSNVLFFFDLKGLNCLIVVPSSYSGMCNCALLKFWIVNDQPTLSSKWMTEQTTLLTDIADSFKEQYSAYLLDNIINS